MFAAVGLPSKQQASQDSIAVVPWSASCDLQRATVSCGRLRP
jgi:hypothetical protein